jgi:hypothetical protein
MPASSLGQRKLRRVTEETLHKAVDIMGFTFLTGLKLEKYAVHNLVSECELLLDKS